MAKKIKLFVLALIAVFALIGTAFASPISVSDVNVQNVNGNYVVLVSLNNANTLSGIYSELSFSIKELGTTKNMGPVTVNSNGTTVLQYNLKDITDSYALLKQGNVYQLTVTTDGNNMTKSFLFGSEKTTKGLGLVLENVKLNDEDLTGIDTLQVVNGETLNLKLRFAAQQNFDNARIMAFIEGYEYSPIIASSKVFAVKDGITYTKTLSLNLPSDMSSEKEYKLRIVGANDLSGLTYKDYTIYVDTKRNRVDINDLVMTPSSGVEPGQNIIANVRLQNRGQRSQDSTKVTVAIPALGVSESSYVTNLNPGKVVTSDDMLLYIPQTAEAKQYNVVVTLSYNDGHTSTTGNYTLNVLSPKTVQEKNLLVSFKNNVDLKATEAKTFNIVVANPNSESKPISITSLNNNWATVQVSPSLAMIKGGASNTFEVTVTPKAGVSGDKPLTLVIKEGAKTISNINVDTYVAPTSTINWVNIALAILLIIAIIILLALVITIAKRKNGEGEETSSTEEYY